MILPSELSKLIDEDHNGWDEDEDDQVVGSYCYTNTTIRVQLWENIEFYLVKWMKSFSAC